MSERDSTPTATDVEIADPEDYTTSQRLKQIYRARKQLREIRRDAAAHRHGARRDKEKIRAVQHYRSGVESYLLEVDTLLRQFDPGPELWNRRSYGTITIRPPGNFKPVRGAYVAPNIEIGPNQPLRVKRLPDPKQVEVRGLRWLFETDSPIQRTFEYQVDSSTLGETYTATANAIISWNQLNEMVTDVNSFLGELGIGLDTDETDEWKI